MLCVFRLATGLPCPFCGLTRSLFALGQGDLGESLRYSPIGPLMAVVAGAAAVALLACVIRRRQLTLPRSLYRDGKYDVTLHVADGGDFSRELSYRLLGPQEGAAGG